MMGEFVEEELKISRLQLVCGFRETHLCMNRSPLGTHDE